VVIEKVDKTVKLDRLKSVRQARTFLLN